MRNTGTSAMAKAANRTGFGRTRANHGNSHRSYCGEYTLFVRKNRARMANPIVHGRNSGSRVALVLHTIAVAAANRTQLAVLTRPVGMHGRSWKPRWQIAYHAVSMSGGRRAWNRQQKL